MNKVDNIPDVDEAGVIALNMIDDIDELSVTEQAFFIAGFQECIKYLKTINKSK